MQNLFRCSSGLILFTAISAFFLLAKLSNFR